MSKISQAKKYINESTSCFRSLGDYKYHTPAQKALIRESDTPIKTQSDTQTDLTYHDPARHYYNIIKQKFAKYFFQEFNYSRNILFS